MNRHGDAGIPQPEHIIINAGGPESRSFALSLVPTKSTTTTDQFAKHALHRSELLAMSTMTPLVALLTAGMHFDLGLHVPHATHTVTQNDVFPYFF